MPITVAKYTRSYIPIFKFILIRCQLLQVDENIYIFINPEKKLRGLLKNVQKIAWVLFFSSLSQQIRLNTKRNHQTNNQYNT